MIGWLGVARLAVGGLLYGWGGQLREWTPNRVSGLGNHVVRHG